ncbi:type VII toxin-antitoxin system HepT family RNase toxin [Orrella daihaiensis]|uniref:DUF86 domain-containing protein n=1 Tax=Orrella daihaiensis TaxID=2782176 RepID=A0ABY4AME5_9BURK|nr:DUF86 domain-containing protein [Orrella daihaiensis]UOD51452.1 DUF86 domain-containing protein [Orrella daihaiensis]
MDLEVISQKLESLTRWIDRIRGTCPQSVAELQKDIDAQDILTLNLSRAVQMTVDVSTHIIACTRAQTPQTMGESFETLSQLGVLDAELAARMRKAVGFRNIAVHNYEAINWEVVYNIATERLDDFRRFVRAINVWLRQASAR